jgi:hypothetical protein
MFSIFSKKKNDQAEVREESKKRSLEDFEVSDGTTVLDPKDMGKIEGGKGKSKPLPELPDIKFTFGGTIPQ